MKIQIEPMLFVDPQTQPEADCCPRCGSVRYVPSLICLRCERDGP